MDYPYRRVFAVPFLITFRYPIRDESEMQMYINKITNEIHRSFLIPASLLTECKYGFSAMEIKNPLPKQGATAKLGMDNTLASRGCGQ